MKFIEFIVNNWDSLLLIVAAVAAVVVAVIAMFKGNKSVVMRMLYALVTEAERIYGGGNGSKKLAAVVEAIYPKLPAIIKMFVTDKMLVSWIEKALAAAKEAWANNPELIAQQGENATEGEETTEAE